MTNIAMTPSHPGEFIRRQIFEPYNLTITQAAEILEVRRAGVSDLANGKADLSPEMALRIEKAFDVKMDFLLRLQALYETYRMRQAGDKISVIRFQPE